MRRPSLVLVAQLLVMLACTEPSSSPDEKSRTLSGGRRVRILSIARVSAGPALALTYETSFPMGNHQDLEKEVDELWVGFRPQAEGAGVRMAIIEARNEQVRERLSV
jgi:hypothetical protein